MTVKELIEQLSQLDPNLRVVVSDDDECNGVHDCFGADLKALGSDGALYLSELTPELIEQGYSEEDLPPEDDEYELVVLL